MNMKNLVAAILLSSVFAFGDGWEVSTKLNAVEWDESSHALYVFLDNPTSGEKDKVYKYDWNTTGNTLESAKIFLAILTAAYSTGSSVHIYWAGTQAIPASITSGGWGTVGTLKAIRQAPDGYSGNP